MARFSSVIMIVEFGRPLNYYNQGGLFAGLDGPEYEKCLDKFDDYAIECASKMSNTTEAMYLSKFGETQCGELRDFRGCLSDKLDSCKAKGVLDLVDLFYRPVVKASPCKKVGGFVGSVRQMNN